MTPDEVRKVLNNMPSTPWLCAQELTELLFWTKELLKALPVRRDWLDPLIEKNLRDAIARAEGGR